MEGFCTLIGLIKAKQSEYALAALKKPADKTEFEYGFRSGYVTAMEHFLNEIENLLEKEQNDY